MKIVYLIEQLYKHGGAEKILTEKANYLVRNGYEVSIITTGQKHHKPVYTLDQNIRLIDTGINYDTTKSYFHPANFAKGLKHYFKLKKVLKKTQPDITILLSDAFDYYFLTFITNAVTLKEFHSSRYNYLKAKKASKALRSVKYKLHDFINKRFDKLVVLNQDEKNMFKAVDNLIVIPNGINISVDKVSELNHNVAIAAGRIAPVKAFDKLILAWYNVAQKHPDWKLHIYGDGNIQLTDDLHKLIQNYKLTKQVCLCGVTNELQSKMQNAGMYVMSSLTECFPMVLLEAQSVGLPIVSFDCPYGPRNIITDNLDGILVEDQNIDKLADAIIKLIDDDEKRKEMGQNAIKNVRKYQFDNVMHMWITLFQKTKKSL